MAIKRLEDFNHDVEVAKELLSSMPINNAKNLVIYKNKVAELKEEYTSNLEKIYNEVKRRCQKYLTYIPSERTLFVQKELSGYKELNLFSQMNTPFEKMGFDTLLYSLTHYYKNDLENVNKDIKEALEKFRLAGITLTENDFIYSNYAKKYIKELLSDDDYDRMKDVFEDLHWKCPEVISHIETSFRILFDKNVKKFEAYIENRKHEILIDNLNYEDYMLRRANLVKELEVLENYNEDVLINKFMTGKLMLNDYNIASISRSYAKFLGENGDINVAKSKNEEFMNLKYNLEEYNNFNKYKFVLDDARNKYQERSSHLGESARIRKEIEVLIDELVRLTKEINENKGKGFFIFRKKVDIEQNYLLINEKVRELDMKYEEYDNALVYEKMNEYLTDTSTVYDVFRFVFAYKTYLRSCIKEQDDTVEISRVKRMVKEFEEFLLDPNITMIKHAAFTVDNDLTMVLMDHYKLLSINLKKDDLNEEGIANLIKMLDIIINNHYLEKYGLTIDYILNLFEGKKIVDIKKKVSPENSSVES